MAVKKKERRDSTASPILRAAFAATDQPVAVSSMKTWYEVWRRNPDVRACVDIVSRTVAKGGVEAKRNDMMVETPETDALIDSFMANKGAIILHSMVGGNAFVAAKRNMEDNTVGVEVLDPRFVTVYSVDAVPSRYVYQDPMRQNRQYSYAAEDVFHWKSTLDPDNPAYGVSPVETIVYDALGDDRAAMANFAFFDNNALPANMVVLKEGVTQDTADKLKEQMQLKYGGAKNSGRSGVMSTAIDKVIELGTGKTEGRFLDMRKVSTEKVCAAMKVPKAMLNYTDGVNYSSSEVQYATFIEQTVRPFESAFEEIMDYFLAPYGCEAEVIDEHISQAKQWSDVAIKLKAAGIIDQNEAREYVGLEPVDTAPVPDPAAPVPEDSMPMDAPGEEEQDDSQL